MRDDFAIFILTHGRPDNQKTLKLLKKFNCRYKIYLVLDNQDNTIQQYIDNYGAESIIVFNKNECVKTTDTGLHEPVFKFAVYARNAIEHIARELGYTYFLMLDDDITNIRVRYNSNNSLKSYYPTDTLDTILEKCVDYVGDTNIACLSLGFCNSYRKGVSILERESSRQRLGAVAFIRNIKHKIDWRLNMVEDLITSIDCGINSLVLLQFIPIQIEVCMSEGTISGGNSDAYNSFGKYKLSFFPTLVYPSCNKSRFVNNHWVTTTTAQDSVPKIISDCFKRR